MSSTTKLFTKLLWLSSDLRRPERAEEREHERERDEERIEWGLGSASTLRKPRAEEARPRFSTPGHWHHGCRHPARSVPQQNWAVLVLVV